MTRLEPYNSILLTIAYVTICVCVGTLLPTCSTDENGNEEGVTCGTEGHDNTFLSWVTDFFLAGVHTMMGIQLYLKTSRKRFAGLSYAFLFLVYLFKGMVSWLFGNSGMDDGRGSTGFFIMTMVYYVFWTVSALLFMFLAQAAWKEIDEGGLQCGRAEARVSLILMVVSTLILITGCMWALFFSVDEVIDEYSDSDVTATSIPITMIQAGQLAWHAFYCAFLVSTAYIWRALAKQRAIDVEGLSDALPAAGIILSQVAIAGIFLFFALDAVSDDVRWGRYNSHTMATVMFNYAMLMTVYFVRSYLLALFPPDLLTDVAETGKGAADTDSDESAIDKSLSRDDPEEADEDIVNQDEWVIKYKDTESDTLFMTEHQPVRDNFEDEGPLSSQYECPEGPVASVAEDILRGWGSFTTTTTGQRVIGAERKATNKSIESSLNGYHRSL